MSVTKRPAFSITTLLLLICAGLSPGQDSAGIFSPEMSDRYQPRAPIYVPDVKQFPDLSEELSSNTEELVKQLVGVVFLEDPKQVSKELVEATGIQVNGGPRLNLLRSQGLQNVVAPYLGRKVSLRSLDEMTRDIVRFYRKNNRPVVDVVVPEQDITNGVVQLVVTEARVGRLMVEGPCHFNPCILANDTCTKPCDGHIYESLLMEDLRWLNRSRYRDVELRLKPGENPGETDIFFDVEDVMPITFYAGYEDSGTRPLGIERTIYGFNWGNAFGRDDNFGYQFTASSDFDTLRAHSGNYTTWFDNRDSLSISGTYATINSDVGGGLLLDGSVWQISTRYDREICPGACCARSCTEHHVVAGFDFKNTNTDLDAGGTNILTAPVEIAQLVFGFNGFSRHGAVNAASWYANLFVGLEGFTTYNNDVAFNSIRPGSDTDYIYARAYYERRWQLPRNFRLVSRFTGQLANDRLQPTEQLGATGYTAVRGYDMREVIGDSGIVSNIEIRTQPIDVGNNSIEDSQLQFLAFYDRASVHNISAIAPEDANTDVSSVGAGLRYRMGGSVSLRADYGWQLESLPNSDRSSRFHVGMTVFR